MVSSTYNTLDRLNKGTSSLDDFADSVTEAKDHFAEAQKTLEELDEKLTRNTIYEHTRRIELYDLAVEALENNDTETACRLLKKACELAEAIDMYNWGVLYLQRKSISNAIKWLERAANKGYSQAQLTLGYFYYIGELVPENIPLAIEWFEKAKATGNDEAEKVLKMISEYDRKIEIHINY